MNACVCRCVRVGFAWTYLWPCGVCEPLRSEHALHRSFFRPLRGNRIPGFWLGHLVGFISVSVPTRGLSNGNILRKPVNT